MSNNKPFIFLAIASLLLAAAWLAAGWAGAGLKQVQAAMQKVEQAEKDIATLKDQLARWEAAGKRSLGSVEPVALDAKFLPSELPKSAVLLAGLYGDHGYFNLRHFSLSWGSGAGAPVVGEVASAAGDIALMTVAGEKVFLGRREPALAVSQDANKGGL